METTIQTSIDIGEVPSLTIESAILDGDATKIALLARQCDDPREFYESMKTHAFNASWERITKTFQRIPCNSTIFMWPIILSDDRYRHSQENVAVSQDLLAAFSSFSDAIKAASHQEGVEVQLLTRAISYSVVSSLEATDFRYLLTEMVSNRSAASIGSARRLTHQSPDGSPVLAFHIGVVTGNRAWPTINERHPKLSDAAKRLKSAIEFTYHGNDHGTGNDFAFGGVSFADTAIENGICLWLTTLNRKLNFNSWDAIPISDGIIEITISLKDIEIEPVVINLQCSHIGMTGIERVLSHISSICESVTNERIN